MSFILQISHAEHQFILYNSVQALFPAPLPYLVFQCMPVVSHHATVHHYEEPCSILLIINCGFWGTAVRFPWSQLFSRPKQPSSLILSSQGMCSCPHQPGTHQRHQRTSSAGKKLIALSPFSGRGPRSSFQPQTWKAALSLLSSVWNEASAVPVTAALVSARNPVLCHITTMVSTCTPPSSGFPLAPHAPVL